MKNKFLLIKSMDLSIINNNESDLNDLLELIQDLDINEGNKDNNLFKKFIKWRVKLKIKDKRKNEKENKMKIRNILLIILISVFYFN